MTKVNWPQAFAEIGLLALGVLVALGGDAWMDDRRDGEAEHAYLVSLREDFKTSEALSRVVRRHKPGADPAQRFCTRVGQPYRGGAAKGRSEESSS